MPAAGRGHSPGLRALLSPAFVMLLIGIGTVTAGDPEVPTRNASPAVGPLRIDGVLDEPDWAGATVIEELTQQEPHPGEPTSFHTQVRILADTGNVYIGFHCVDPEPDRIAAHTLSRDGDLEGDDRVTIILDTYLDSRTGYFFAMNAEGARQDGLISSPDTYSTDWDGIWYGRSRRTPEGWDAEFVIPAKSLHFNPGAPEWGFNVERTVPRERLRLRWAWSLSPDIGFSLLTQYESESETLGLNARFRWTIRPGDDLFVVWTRDWRDTDPESAHDFMRQSDAVIAKLRWTFRR